MNLYLPRLPNRTRTELVLQYVADIGALFGLDSIAVSSSVHLVSLYSPAKFWIILNLGDSKLFVGADLSSMSEPSLRQW